MFQSKLILLILICSIFLDVALTHDPGRGYGGSQHHHIGQRGRGRHGGQQGRGSHSGHGGGPPAGPPGGNPAGTQGSPSAAGHPHTASPEGHDSSSRDSGSNDQISNQGSVISRCLLEKKSALIHGMTNRESRNVTAFIPRCGPHRGFRCHQEWSAVGLSWQTDNVGRMVDNTLTKGRPNCPITKDSRQTLVCLHESKRFRCQHGTTLSIEEIKLSRKPAPGKKCRHHAMNEYNSTGSADHSCNVTKVTKNVRSRCQGRRECRFNLNKRLLGKDCVREVKYIMVNLTCDRKESGKENEATYVGWNGGMIAICINDNDDNDDESINIGNNDEGSGLNSDDVGDDDDGDIHDGDDSDDDVNDNDDGFVNEDDVDDDTVNVGQRMGGMSHSRQQRSGPSNHQHHHHHFSRFDWIQQPDLYKEFNFNAPLVCPKNRPMQSNCNPTLCQLVKCEEHINISCRVNPCGTCRPECYNVNGSRASPPRALTKCEHKRLTMKYRLYVEINIVPRCNDDGSFAEIQCFPEAKTCWCVDEHGRERNGTRQTGKPTNCKVSGPVLSQCQSSQLNIKNLKEHLSKMASTYNETANNLKFKANNATQWMQQQPMAIPQNQSHRQRNSIRHQVLRARVCRKLVRGIQRKAKYFTEPKCAADGSFESIQCGPSGKKCWCVNGNGKMVGFMKSQDKLNCSYIGKERSNTCPPVVAHAADQPSPCGNDSDCSDSKVCCKTQRRRRECVDPLPRTPAVKPGKCPVVPHSVNFTCPSHCKSDADCRDDMKCCRLGCGRRCIPANMPECPRDKPFKLCIYDKCLSSPGCPSHRSARCRMNNCGECTAEYFDENGRKIDCSNATKCQKERHAAIESYKRKFFQAFNTLPVNLPGALNNRSRGKWGRMGGQRRASSAGRSGQDRAGGGYNGRAGRRQPGWNRNGRQDRQQESQQSGLGVYIPECHPENGSFLSEQCNVTSGVCWCVDTNGQEKSNTRVKVQRGTRDCGGSLNVKIERVLPKGNKVQQKQNRVARLNLRLKGSFDKVMEKKEQFIKNLKEKVASICGCKKEQIRNVEIWRGSVNVKFELVEDEDGASLEESVQLLHTEVKSLNFVIILDGKEYRSDGAFKAYTTNHHGNKNNKQSGHLSLVETIAIGSCAAASLLLSAVFSWKYFGRSKKPKPEGWKDIVKEKPPEVQYVTPNPKPILFSGVTNSVEPSGVKASETSA